jgi:hypothetical protein
MSLRVKVLIAVTLAAFAVIHLAAAYKVEAGTARKAAEVNSLQRD